MERALSLLFPVRHGRFQVMHKTVVDWLKDKQHKSQYHVGREQIHSANQSMVITSDMLAEIRVAGPLLSPIQGRILHSPCLVPPVYGQTVG